MPQTQTAAQTLQHNKRSYSLSLLQRLRYRYLGPTTLHLYHESYLLLSLTLLTTSSLASFYRHSFGTLGDLQIILATTLWLSRHLILRIMCTNDTSTSPYSLTQFISRYFTAGQYFSALSPRSIHHLSNDTSYHPPPSPAQKIILFICKAVQWIMSLKRTSHPNTIDDDMFRPPPPSSSSSRRTKKSTPSSAPHHHPSSSNMMTSSPLYRQIEKYWEWAPPAQLCVAILSTLIIILGFFFYPYAESRHAIRRGIDNDNGWNSSPQRNGGSGSGSAGVGSTSSHRSEEYRGVVGGRHLEALGGGGVNVLGPFGPGKPGILRFLFVIACAGTLASLIMYGRVILPLPDLVSGGNASRAVRAEQRDRGDVGRDKKKGRRDGGGWAERYKSIVYENRFKLFFKVAVLRTLENLFLCAIIPQFAFACKISGHCEGSPVLWERTVAMGVKRRDSGVFDRISVDRLSMASIAGSVVVVSINLLLSQMLALDGRYLAIMGHVSDESMSDGNQTASSNASVGDNIPTTSRGTTRRYKKGLPPSNDFHKDGGNAPSSGEKQIDFYFKTARLLKNELGQSSTSTVLSFATKMHAYHIVYLICLCIFYHMMGYDSFGLKLALMADLVAGYGMIRGGLMNYGELNELNRGMEEWWERKRLLDEERRDEKLIAD